MAVDATGNWAVGPVKTEPNPLVPKRGGRAVHRSSPRPATSHPNRVPCIAARAQRSVSCSQARAACACRVARATRNAYQTMLATVGEGIKATTPPSHRPRRLWQDMGRATPNTDAPTYPTSVLYPPNTETQKPRVTMRGGRVGAKALPAPAAVYLPRPQVKALGPSSAQRTSVYLRASKGFMYCALQHECAELYRA